MNYEKESIEILQTFASNLGVWILDSGGKDSSVLKHIALKSGVPIKVEHSHTTVDAPETVYFIRQEQKQFESMGIHYQIEYPKFSMWDLIVKHLFPPTRLMRYCRKELKENFGEGKRIATGVRHAESRNRKENQGVITIVNPKDKSLKDNENFQSTSKRGVVVLNIDNTDTRKIIEHCITQSKVLINPLIYWDDEFTWWYIRHNDIKINPLYEQGFCRVGCIGCPMAGKDRYKQFARYPQYKANYIKAFDRMIDVRNAKGLETRWKDGKSCFKWWMEDKNIDGQLGFDEFGNIVEE